MKIPIRTTDDPNDPWGQALWGFHDATDAICKLAMSPEYRDSALQDLGEISAAVLAGQLMVRHLERKKVA